MEQQIMLLLFLIVGIIGGVAITWVMLKNRNETVLNQTRSESQIENTRLNERLLAVQEDNTRNQQIVNEYEQQINSLRNQLNDVQNQRTKLEERASRVALLEQELEKYRNGIAGFREKITELSTQLGERNQEKQATEQRLQTAINSEKLNREKIEQLQTKLQEETNRNATLAEQVIYLPELQEKFNQLEKEQNQLIEKLANYREKIGSSETTINHQKNQINQLEEEKQNLISSESKLVQSQKELTAKVAELATQLEAEKNQVLEKTETLNQLEQQLEKSNNLRDSIQEQITKLSTQLAERTQGQEIIEQRLQTAILLEKETREKYEQLQIKLQEETNRNATLAEQVIYLPELQEKFNQLEKEQNQLIEKLANYREKIGSSETTISNQLEQLKRLEQEKNNLNISKTELLQNQQELTAKVAELTTQLESERAQSGEKIALLNEAKTELTNQFKSLANDILEEKSKRFTEQNQANIEQVLNPLKIKLQEFQGKVEEVYIQEGKDRSTLAEQVRQLMTLNKQLSEDAHNLTTALKGQAKAQGNWGEFILERVLENSGLTKGEHYVVQESHNREDGTRALPDVVINLPESRHLVIDAKVSIVAYNDYVNAENNIIRNTALKRHIDSVKNHIKGLSSKNYQELHQLKSLDFVIMFVPVEPAFMLTIEQDSNLWQEAWSKNVLLVSPSTLLFVVRTVAHLWRQEQQTRNAQDIAKRGGELYDKLVGFVEDFEKIGERLKQTQKSYDDAFGKFANGRGNVIRQAEMLKEMGIKPTKSLSPSVVELGLSHTQEIK